MASDLVETLRNVFPLSPSTPGRTAVQDQVLSGTLDHYGVDLTDPVARAGWEAALLHVYKTIALLVGVEGDFDPATVQTIPTAIVLGAICATVDVALYQEPVE